jgi:predicted metalloprotease with PDZ domain
LLADLEIREKSENRRSLDDALRGVLAAGGTAAVRWNIERALDEGDRATGMPTRWNTLLPMSIPTVLSSMMIPSFVEDRQRMQQPAGGGGPSH